VKAASLRLIAFGVVYSVLTSAVTGAPNDVAASDSGGEAPRFSLTPLFGYRRNDTQVDNLNVGFGSNEPVPTGFKFSNSSARHTSLDLQGEFRPWRFLRLYGIVGYDDRRSDMTVTTPEQSFTIPVVIEIPDIPDIELPPTAVPLVYYPELEEIIKLLPELPSEIVLDIPITVPSAVFEAGSSLYGPTVGAGLALRGDVGILFAELDANYRYTDYRSDFNWIEGSADTWQGFARAGVTFSLSETIGCRLWGGAHYLDSRTDIKGEIPLKELDADAASLLGDVIVFNAVTEVQEAWSGIAGMDVTVGAHWHVQLEGGVGDTSYVSFGGGASF